MKYVNLIINNKSEKTDKLYTYGCEYNDVQVGSKVYVPFNRGNTRKEAYVFSVADQLEEDIKGLKYVEDIDKDVSLHEEIIKTCRWMRERYLCKYIDAVNCFVPAGKPSARGKKRNPYEGATGEAQTVKQLTEGQKQVLSSITKAIDADSGQRFLLQGVTGSGKTEIYMQAIHRVLKKKKTAIMLVPEISLTKQIIERFIGRFGAENIAVLHSKLSLGERHDEWTRIRKGKVKIVIGARSAVFAPLKDIGMIILDEEHETTYKSDMTPKYDTVEVAIKRLNEYKGILLLGSATPSIVTYNRAEEGIYKKLELTQRYNQIPLPAIKTVDMRQELREGNTTIFSRQLYEAMKDTLAQKEQIILFLNRRGYSNFISCRECGETMKCPSCGISLTYHKEKNKMICHYCGHEAEVPRICPSCKSRYIKYFGIGTEQVEESVKKFFQGNQIARLDLDTIKRKGSTEKILNGFASGNIEILIGTQLVAKGLDFKNVGLVGIVSADVTLNIPDFRSPERTFQLITQAAGRAGRGDKKGKVVIQSYTPENYAIERAAQHDYKGFYQDELTLRKYMMYPPYSDLIQIVFSAKEEEEAQRGGTLWEKEICGRLKDESNHVFPLQPAPMNKIKETYRYSLLIKSPRGQRAKYMGAIRCVKDKMSAEKKQRYTVSIDINPYSFL